MREAQAGAYVALARAGAAARNIDPGTNAWRKQGTGGQGQKVMCYTRALINPARIRERSNNADSASQECLQTNGTQRPPLKVVQRTVTYARQESAAIIFFVDVSQEIRFA